MGDALILAIDQGTTSSRALVVDAAGGICGLAQRPFAQHYPQPGWVEHDPLEIWETTRAAIGEALAGAGADPREITAIGITNQRETVVAWERATGRPVANAIVWQDRRTAGFCDDLRAAGREPEVAAVTGLTLDPYFSATKLTWLLRNVPGLRQRAEAGELAAGTVDAWLTWQLTGGKRHVTDYTNASRTLLFNIRRGRWDAEMMALFEIPRGLLPVPQPSRSKFGLTDETVFGAAVPILGIAGDQQAALFGQACFAPGQAKNTYGTGCFLLGVAGNRRPAEQGRLLVSLGARSGPAGPEYVTEGSVFVAGAAVQWLVEALGLASDASTVQALAESVPDAGGVVFVPAFTGLGAPDWDPYARGAILGLTRGTTRAHIARAALDAIALSTAELVEAMNALLPEPIRELRVDGGAARNDLLLQLQADLLGVPVVRPKEIETTALGAAYLAGLEAGVWASEAEVASLARTDRVFEPAMGEAERGQRRRQWRRGVERTLGWAAAP